MSDWPGIGRIPFGSAIRDSSTQSIPVTTATAITFTTEEADRDNMVDISGANTKITIVTPGLYLVRGLIVWNINGTGVRMAALRKNGSGTYLSRVAFGTATSGDYTEQEVTWVGDLVATDYVELIGYQSSGGALTVRGDDSTATRPRLQAVRLGDS